MKGWAFWWPLALQLGLVAYLGWWTHKLRLGRQKQDALLEELAPGAGCRWFRVQVSRSEAFARRLKTFPFEGSGLLLDSGDAVRVVAQLWNGERLDRLLPRPALQIEWAGGGALGPRVPWLRLKGHGDELMVAADVGLNAHASRHATADLFRTLLPGQPLPPLALGGFALDKNRASATATGVLLALLLLAGVDAMANELELLSDTAFVILPLVGELAVLPLLGALLSLPLYPVLRRQQVPTAESAGLTLLMVIAMALASVPFAKRLDQLLAPEPQARLFRLVGPTSLEPVQPGPPALQFPTLKKYWAQFEPGSEHSFLLVHGPLGLWQLDREPLFEKTRAFYAEHGEAPLVKPRADATPAAGHPASTAPAPTR